MGEGPARGGEGRGVLTGSSATGAAKSASATGPSAESASAESASAESASAESASAERASAERASAESASVGRVSVGSVSVEVVDPRHDPEPDGWRDLAASARRRAVWSYDLLRTAAWTSRHPVLLAIAREAGRPVAAVSAVLAGPRLRSYAPSASVRAPRLALPTVAVPGSSAERGWFFAPGVDAADQRALLARCARRLRRAAGAAAPGVLWLRAEADDRAHVPGVVRVSRPLNPLAQLATPWSDLDGWLASLSKSRRVDLRRQRRALSFLDCRVGPARDLVEGREVAELLWRNEAKYEGGHLPSTPLALPYVEALTAHPDVVAVAYRDAAEHLVGIALLLDHPTWPLYWRWGAEPVRHLYFDSYARLLEWAITNGKRGVILGKGKSDLKAALGAELVPSYAVAAGP